MIWGVGLVVTGVGRFCYYGEGFVKNTLKWEEGYPRNLFKHGGY